MPSWPQGRAAAHVAHAGAGSDIIFVMVVDARHASAVILGEGGRLSGIRPGSVVVVTATIGRPAVMELAAHVEAAGCHFIDSPVSGGRKGAEAGELTLMMSGNRSAYEAALPAFQAIAKDINYLGEEVGMGQAMKAWLQGLVGCIYAGMFEALVLGVKSGLTPESIFATIGTSVAGTPLWHNSVPAIMARRFADSGSNIYNTDKDLTITMALAQESGVPMATTGTATQFFQAATTKFPKDDNECLVKILEDIVGVEVRAAGTA